jgi:hypothetical protein
VIVLSWAEFIGVMVLSGLLGAGAFAFRLWCGEQLRTPQLDAVLPVVKNDVVHVRHEELNERVRRRAETKRRYPLPRGRKDGAA